MAGLVALSGCPAPGENPGEVPRFRVEAARVALAALDDPPGAGEPGRVRFVEAVPSSCPGDPLACDAPYVRLAGHRDALDGEPARDCRAMRRRVEAVWRGERGPTEPGWGFGDELAEGDVPAALLAATGLSPLILDRTRTLDVVLEPEVLRGTPSGGVYRERRVRVGGTALGSWDGLLLLPASGDGPWPGLLALPGHGEGAASHRDRRYARFFPERGYAVLIPTFRAYDSGVGEDRATEALMCAGGSLFGARIAEAIDALSVLRAQPEVQRDHLGIVGHSGGSVVADALAWLPPGLVPVRAIVSDLRTGFLNLYGEGNRLYLSDETHAPLRRISEAVMALDRAPRPVLLLDYAYRREPGVDPDPDDRSVIDQFMPFLDRHLRASVELERAQGERRPDPGP